jgi:hypothetical protein
MNDRGLKGRESFFAGASVLILAAFQAAVLRGTCKPSYAQQVVTLPAGGNQA